MISETQRMVEGPTVNWYDNEARTKYEILENSVLHMYGITKSAYFFFLGMAVSVNRSTTENVVKE